MFACVGKLKEWTGKTSATIVYDSDVDEFTDDTLFEKVKGKPNIAVVGFTTDGDVFGGFFRFAVDRQGQYFHDPTMFVFSFESRGRCETPQRFMVKKEEFRLRTVVGFIWKNSSNGFVNFWVNYAGGFCLGNEKSNSYCCDMSCGFEGLDDTTLTGQNNTDCDFPPYHHCTRLVAVLFE